MNGENDVGREGNIGIGDKEQINNWSRNKRKRKGSNMCG